MGLDFRTHRLLLLISRAIRARKGARAHRAKRYDRHLPALSFISLCLDAGVRLMREQYQVLPS
jgi:hypothetical protein